MSHLFRKVKERDDYQISKSCDEVKSCSYWDRGQLSHWVGFRAMKCPSDLTRSLVSMAINLPFSQGSCFFSLHVLIMSVIQWCIWSWWFLVWAFNYSVASQNAILVHWGDRRGRLGIELLLLTWAVAVVSVLLKESADFLLTVIFPGHFSQDASFIIFDSMYFLIPNLYS